MEELVKIKSNVSLETKTEIIHTLIFPISLYACKSWTVKEVDRKKNWFMWSMVLEVSSTDTLDSQKDSES